MFVSVHSSNPDDRIIKEVIQLLKSGEIIIYPTDSVYAVGCDLFNPKGLEKLARFKDVKLSNAQFSIITSDISQISEYTMSFDRPTFKILKSHLPGPFTFVMEASKKVSKLFKSNRHELGVRIVDNKIAQAIVSELGNPLVTTSLHNNDAITSYYTDPNEIFDSYDGKVAAIIDGGIGKLEETTVVSLTGNTPEILRQGIGDLEL